MAYSDFVKPYIEGWEDSEVGNTPITAAILNNNYDSFLLSLNNWSDEIESAIGGKSTVSWNEVVSTGTKIATVTIDGTDYDIYAPSGGGGGSSVSWTQIQATGTKIATITIDGTSYDVYVPSDTYGDTVTWTQIQLTGTKIASISINGVSQDIYVPSGGGGGSSVSFTQVLSTGTKIGIITIDGSSTDIYAPSGGGGTTVVANPSGTAVDTLTKLQVGNDIYDIPTSSKDYSTDSVYAGYKWIDGGKVYKKVIDKTSSPVSVGSSSMSSNIYINDFLSKPLSCVGISTNDGCYPLNVEKYDSSNIKVQSSIDNLSIKYFILDYVRETVLKAQCITKYNGGNDATVTLNTYDDTGTLINTVDVYLYDHMGEQNAVTLGCLKVYYSSTWILKCANYPCAYNGTNYNVGDTISTWNYDVVKDINNVKYAV